MNPFLMIGICLIVALMVLFGHNPMDDIRRERELRLAGKDPLILSIEDHNKKNPGIFSGFGGAGRAPGYTPPNTTNNVMRIRTGQPPVIQDPNSLDARKEDERNGEGYYPPPPENINGKPHSELSPELQKWMNISPVSPVMTTLRSGQRIGFVDTRVYTYDTNGKPIVMPDGKYTMNGGYDIYVKDGHKMIFN